MLFGKTFELPIVKSYVSRWGLEEAVREILQNAIDSESPFEWEFKEGTLLVHSRYALLTPSTLLLGSTSKSENPDSIGSFGEGYKIALLVLTRMGYEVIVHNGKNDWRPSFKASRQFGDAETLHITESAAPVANQGVTFEVRGLSASDIEAIKASCLHMQQHIGQVIQTSKGMVLLERPGKLYVGGLFVCDTNMLNGYDMKPQYLRLERDRQTVANFDLAWLTKEMWFETERHEQCAELIAKKAPEMEYAHHGAPALVREACYQHFKAAFPDDVVVESAEELKRLVDAKMTNVQYIDGSYGSILRSVQPKNELLRKKLPHEILEQWLRDNRAEMRTKAIVSFKDIIETAKEWKP